MEGAFSNILLVEDNPDHAELIVMALREGGTSNYVCVVGDGFQALDFLYGRGVYKEKRGTLLPTLILLDIKLPKMDGLELLREIRKDPQFNAIPVIVLTTSSRPEDVAEAYAAGANSYVAKPARFQEFLDRIQRVEYYWTCVNVPPAYVGRTP